MLVGSNNVPRSIEGRTVNVLLNSFVVVGGASSDCGTELAAQLPSSMPRNNQVWAAIDAPLLERTERGGLVSQVSAAGSLYPQDSLVGTEERSGMGSVELTIEFYGLTWRLRSYNKILLRGATGKLRSSRLTAIMGPSGAGLSLSLRCKSCCLG